MASQSKTLLFAILAGSMLAACAEAPPKAIDFEAVTATLGEFQELEPVDILCDAEKRGAFADFVTLYSEAQAARGRTWPNLSGDHGAPDWMTKISLSGAIAGFIPADKFDAGRSTVRNMLGEIQLEATRNRPKAKQMAATFGNEIITPLAKDDVADAAKVACPTLIAYAGEMTEAQYIRDFAFGPQNGNFDAIQGAIRQYNTHIGKMFDLKKEVLTKVQIAQRSAG